MNTAKLQIQHLDKKMRGFSRLQSIVPPPNGWLKATRTALGMSMQQLGNRLGITKQSVANIESREQEGSITIKALREAGQAMDMQLVYGFVPNDGTLEKLVERKAHELAVEIVMRTSQTMRLEDQQNSPKRLEKAIEERTAEIMYIMPKALWD